MAAPYSIAQLNTQTMLEELSKQSQEREAAAATGQQKKGIMTKVSREMEEAQRKAARKAREKSKKYGMIGKLASFGLGFVPGAGIWLSALASSAANNRIARMQQKTLQNLTKNLDLGWMGKTFASQGIKDWKEDVGAQAKEIGKGTEFGSFATDFAKNAAMSFAMSGITEGISKGIKNAKAGSDFQNLKDSLDDSVKNKHIQARKNFNKPNTSITKFDSLAAAKKAGFGDRAMQIAEDGTVPDIKDLGLTETPGIDTSKFELNPGDTYAITSAAEKSSALAGNDIQRFMKGLDKSGFEGEDWLKLIAMLSPEESGFDIQSDPMSYIGRYK